ncbi:MAG: holo-[acyl-carrier-protein] synthase [Terriglobales bacterium]
MIVGTGIDIVEVPRIAAALKRFGQRFVERLFTPAEIRYCDSKHNRAERYAARFAAKEAGMKAIGTGWRGGVSWRELEVRNQAGGRPALTYSGKAAEFAARLGVKRVSLSLSHTEQHAIAQVILED